MKEGFIKVSEEVSIPIHEYANKANTILGIRGGGKTYTGTMFAEQLMDHNIPILVIDPIGVWHNLKYGVNGNAGYPVVVAGGMSADINLTEHNVIDIVQAALIEGISLIIDLFGMETATKSSWIKIVSDVVQYLTYNNKKYSKTIRHVFIEEASEFIPQRPGPGNAAIVYSRIESMTRMGRNCGIGVTFINQRAQEIAKSVFELCENVIIHQQTGKNSLLAVQDWLKLKGANSKEVVESLPGLAKGECWIITGTTETRTKVSEKKTLHPDPENSNENEVSFNSSPPNISDFIARIKEAMNINKPKTFETKNQEKVDAIFDKAFEDLKAENALLIDENKELRERLNNHEIRLYEIAQIAQLPDYKPISVTNILNKLPVIQPDTPFIKEYGVLKVDDDNKKPSVINTKSGQSRILNVVAMVYPKDISKVQIGLYCKLIPTSGSFNTYLSNLKRSGFIHINGKYVVCTATGINTIGKVENDWNATSLVKEWIEHLGGTIGKIFECIANSYPFPIAKEEIGSKLNLSITGGSFNTYLATLKKYNLIIKESNEFKLNPEFFFIIYA